MYSNPIGKTILIPLSDLQTNVKIFLIVLKFCVVLPFKSFLQQIMQ